MFSSRANEKKRDFECSDLASDYGTTVIAKKLGFAPFNRSFLVVSVECQPFSSSSYRFRAIAA